MKFLLRTLSLSYVKRHLGKTLLTLLAVVVGVATYSSIKSAQGTLVRGIISTIDRVAGKAHLQITMVGGVPEEVQEQIRELPGIRATSPVIEQIVTPEQGELGSILVIGIDLLGDREMREYGFEGEDADLDDPLLFLAQPDSVIFARQFAEKAHLKIGDSISLQAPKGLKRVVVRGLLTPKGFAEAFGGNLMVVDVYAAQDLFGRGRRFDRLDVRLMEGTSVAQGIAILEKFLGPAYRIETPAKRGEQMEKLVANFVAGFNFSSALALSIGTFLIFNAFNVAVNRRRRDIGTLRALGATPRQVQLLFLSEALIIGLLGGALGCMAGTSLAQAFLQMMGQTTETIYGVTSSGAVRLPPEIVVQSIILGMLASLVGAWGPALNASRVSPMEAFARGVFQTQTPSNSRLRIGAGLLFLASAIFLGLHPFFGGNALIFSVLVLGGIGVVFLVGPLSRRLLLSLVPLMNRVTSVAGLLSSDALLGNARRTSGTIMAMTLSLSFVLGLGGYMGSSRKALMIWMNDALTSDLFVRASANFNRPDFLFPSTLRAELLQVPGVTSVESYRAIHPLYDGHQILITSIEMQPIMERINYEFIQGNPQSMLRGLTEEGKCAVSDNFFRRHKLGVGQQVELATPSGKMRCSIAAVVRDYSSDQGSILMDRAQFIKIWKDDRVDIFDVSVAPGAEVGKVRDDIRRMLAGRFPALVSTRQEFTAEISKAVDAFYSLTQVTVFLALIVAFLGIVTALLISVAERTREIGILKALGALPGQLARSIILEALLLALVGLLLSIPVGNLLAAFLEGPLAEIFTGWVMPHFYPWDILLQLLIALPIVSMLAAWLPAIQAGRMKITEAIEHE
ncbi:MAG: ABC transporter permease [Bdellovibrionales bacterium GWA2_49_15]|nr:MAG: ABC transporter permease [Bdellovibrionales bacterium GWA2_49_15]HAZ13568.1 ABC transporter permease [Bdellovibrionales bacterium]